MNKSFDERANELSSKLRECLTQEKREKLAKELGFESYVGSILMVSRGRTANIDNQVQFNMSDNGWSSSWPDWAYHIACDAFLHGKKAWIVSDGVPFGANLVVVALL